MEAERWHKLQELFHGALDRQPNERRAFLEESCGEDHTLLDQASALLEASTDAETAIEGAIRSALESSTAELEDTLEGGTRRIGPYRLLGVLGRGGLSTVYLAERADEQFRMQVALKLLRRGMESRDLLRRLRQERQILASLDHPNIARLYDGGSTQEGLPYFVMERIDGEPIDTYCDRLELSVERRLALFQQVCAAVHYAHQNLVVHRDLKPSNILVTTEGVPKLLDFGIAKLLRPTPRDAESRDATSRDQADGEVLAITAPQERLLTPAYASPEQLRGQTLTTATDIYSLGVLLYRLLTGRLPYELPSDQPRELERIVCEVEPTKPSLGDSPPKLRRRLSGDLDNIVLQALRKEPARRYSSVAQLGEELSLHLRGLPVTARPATLSYRLSKFVRRHRTAVTATAAVLLTLAALATFYTVQLRGERDRAHVARDEADRSRLRAEQVSDFLRDLLENADPSRSHGSDVKVRQVLEQGASRIGNLSSQPQLQASLMSVIGNVYQSLNELEEARPLLAGALEIETRLHGEQSPAVAAAKIQLEELLFDLGQIDAAQELVEQALATQRRTVGEEHEDAALSLANLGTVYYMQGDLAAAEQKLRQALRIWRTLGREDRETAICLHNLGVVLHDQGQLSEAETTYAAAYDLKRRLLGEVHPDIAVLLFNLGSLDVDRGNHLRAAERFAKAVAMRDQLFGGPDADGLRIAAEQAKALWHGGEPEQASALFGSTLQQVRALELSPGQLAYLLQTIAEFRLDQGEPAAAEKLLVEALALRRGASSPDSCRIATAEGLLGKALLARQQFDRAEPLLLASLRALPQCAPEPSDTQEANRRLARLYQQWGKPTKAAAYEAAR